VSFYFNDFVLNACFNPRHRRFVMPPFSSVAFTPARGDHCMCAWSRHQCTGLGSHARSISGELLNLGDNR
jgi:hypothetical protein